MWHLLPRMAILSLVAIPCSAQQTPLNTAAAPGSTLHASAHLVPIAAVVLDRNGQPSVGLTKEDFALKEDGKEQPIRYFSEAQDLPLSFALLVDVSASQSTMVEDETRASDIFFETMLHRQQDRAMLVQFDTTIQQLKAMTNDPSLLQGALGYMKKDKDAVGGTRVLDAVYGVAEKVLATTTGRKAIVLITDGGDTDSRMSLDNTIREAQRENVAVYSICYRASNAGMSGAPQQYVNAMVSHSDTILRRLADETGGAVFRVTSNMPLQEILAQIGDRLSKQYEIGYVPSSDIKTNRFHTLQLKTKDPHMKVQARTEFFAAP